MKFWVCSECNKVVDHELEIVEVVDDLYPIKEESGRVHAVPQSSYRLFCSSCINHITGKSAGYPIPAEFAPEIQIEHALCDGLWVTDAPISEDVANLSAEVLRYVDPSIHKSFTVRGNKWRWKECK